MLHVDLLRMQSHHGVHFILQVLFIVIVNCAIISGDQSFPWKNSVNPAWHFVNSAVVVVVLA